MIGSRSTRNPTCSSMSESTNRAWQEPMKPAHIFITVRDVPSKAGEDALCLSASQESSQSSVKLQDEVCLSYRLDFSENIVELHGKLPCHPEANAPTPSPTKLAVHVYKMSSERKSSVTLSSTSSFPCSPGNTCLSHSETPHGTKDALDTGAYLRTKLSISVSKNRPEEQESERKQRQEHQPTTTNALRKIHQRY